MMGTEGTGRSDNPLVNKLAANEATTCLPIRMSRSIHVLQMAKVAGFDSVYFDMEHGTFSLDDVSALSLAAWNMGLTPLVRVPNHGREHIVRTLDGGAAGIIVPQVSTAIEARAIVEAARFRPRGTRALAGASPPLGYAPISADAGSAILEARTLVIVMAETVEAIANADAICAVDGIDMILVGAGDLSDELGIHGQSGDPRIRAAFEAVAAACRRHGRWLGVAGVKQQPDVIRDLRSIGASFISASTDESLLLKAIITEAQNLAATFTGRAS
jgi:2-keto-3-deoxy-L-rhamnonate aldolase RhmA